MNVINTKNTNQLLQSLLAESAKTINEIKCARADLDKATSRMKFCLMLINVIRDRQGETDGSKESSKET